MLSRAGDLFVRWSERVKLIYLMQKGLIPRELDIGTQAVVSTPSSFPHGLAPGENAFTWARCWREPSSKACLEFGFGEEKPATTKAVSTTEILSDEDCWGNALHLDTSKIRLRLGDWPINKM